MATLAPLAATLLSSETQNAVANGDTRTLTIFHVHTKETTTVTFRVNGSYDAAALEKLNWALRDWRRDEPTKMDPRLFDAVWEVYRESGSSQPIWIMSAYRSPETNAMLRRRSRSVAEFSQHMLGKAMDVHFADMPMQKVRDIAMRLQHGGVGYYPTSGTPFVHIDVGSVRYWPRMSRYEMARIFPDGKTVDIPADGQPMPRYNEALADIQARGGSAYSASVASGPGKSLFASLFGGEDEDSHEAPTSDDRRAVASAATGTTRGSPFAWATQSNPVQQAVATAQPADTVKAPAKPLLLAQADIASKSDSSPASALVHFPEAKGDVPVPPRRPADLAVADAGADVPIPPARPADIALYGADPAMRQPGAPATILASADPMAPIPSAVTAAVRIAALPGIITEGSDQPVHVVSQGSPQPTHGALLAFAEVPPPSHFASAPAVPVLASTPPAARVHVAVPRKPGAVAKYIPVLVPAQINRSNFRTLTASAPTSQATAYADQGTGSAMAPLRAAMRSDVEVAAFAPFGSAVTRFARTVNIDLTTDRFSGPAVKALAVASSAGAVLAAASFE